jgi:phage shock protein A
MGIWQRIKRIFKSQANAALDKLENPEQDLALVTDELHTQQKQSRLRLLDALAQQKQLEHAEAELQEQIQRWEQKAMQAINAGHDDLAREALVKKAEKEFELAQQSQELKTQKNMIEALKRDEQELEQALTAALQRRDDLVARYRRAKAKNTIGDAISGNKANSPMAEWHKINRDIEVLEEQVVLAQEVDPKLSDVVLEQQIRALRSETSEQQDTQRDLEALKARMQKNKNNT